MLWVLIASCCAVLGSDNPAFLSSITPVIIRVFQIDCEKLSPLQLCGSATCCLLLLSRLTLAWSLSNLAQLRAVPPVDVAHAVCYTTESSTLILRVSTPSTVCSEEENEATMHCSAASPSPRKGITGRHRH